MFTKRFVLDLVERMVGAFLAGATAVLVVVRPDDLFSGETLKAAAAGGVVSLLTALKGTAASFRGDSRSASLRRDG